MALKITESTFSSWSKPPSDTEDSKCTNAVNMICDAINEDTALSKMDIQVFAQGSYKNNTNVRLNSDVDVSVRLMDTVYLDLPDGTQKSDFGLSDSNYTFSEYKNSVEQALVKKFGRTQVKRGNKAIDIKSNSYRIEADAVPCFEHRRYLGTKDYYGNHNYLSGTEFWSDDNNNIRNWPIQHFENGVQKNNDTNYDYKKMVRVFKKLNLVMKDDGIEVSKRIGSFLIESLLWNTPNNIIAGYSTYGETVKQIIIHLYNNTDDYSKCKEWGEVSELKYLFRGTQSWTLTDVNLFLVKAWNYVGYAND